MLKGAPPDAQRRAYANVAILAAVIAAFFAAIHFGSIGVMVLAIAGAAYLPAFSAYKLIRARPRASTAAWLWWAAMTAAFVVVGVTLAATKRLSIFELLATVILVWMFLIRERGIVFDSVFARDGGASDRVVTIRAARRAARTPEPKRNAP